MAEEVLKKVKDEQHRIVVIDNAQLLIRELRCSNCGRKLAEPNRHGILAGSIRCKACKQITEVL